MSNPILQMLNRNGATKQNNILGMLASLKNGNSEEMAQRMLETNPQFRRFVEENRGKSPEQIARENGIDFESVKNLFR